MRRRVVSEADMPAQINIVPMIDVTFSILAFFIMSTLSLSRLESVSVNLPKAATAKAQASTKAILSVNAQGELFLNRKPIAANTLQAAIQTIQKEQTNLVVVLNADRAIAHGQVVEIMDQLRLIPGVKMSIATQKPV